MVTPPLRQHTGRGHDFWPWFLTPAATALPSQRQEPFYVHVGCSEHCVPIQKHSTKLLVFEHAVGIPKELLDLVRHAYVQVATRGIPKVTGHATLVRTTVINHPHQHEWPSLEMSAPLVKLRSH
jgi:hypothetical protein